MLSRSSRKYLLDKWNAFIWISIDKKSRDSRFKIYTNKKKDHKVFKRQTKGLVSISIHKKSLDSRKENIDQNKNFINKTLTVFKLEKVMLNFEALAHKLKVFIKQMKSIIYIFIG